MDTLAIDRNNRPVIIEYKADKSSTVLLQGLFYMDWLVENKAEFEKLVEYGRIEMAPLAFMRGRTLNDAFVILDHVVVDPFR